MNYPITKTSVRTSKKGSVKNVFLIIVAILLIGGAFAYAEYKNKVAKNIYVAPKVSATDNTDLSQDIDTDSDGMRDWEEILLGTDPKDPRSKGKMPTSNSQTAAVSEDLTIKKDPLTATDLISRDFFARYMELRQLGTASDKSSQEEVAFKTVGNIVLPEPKAYVLGEIKTKSDNSREAVKQYGNEISTIFKKYSIQTRNEAVIAKEAMEKEDPEILKEIDPIIASYKGIINSLIKVEVPSAMATMHLDLTNSINSALFIAQAFRNVETDAIASVQAVNIYQTVEKKLIASTSAIKSYFSYLGIIFGPTEPGYLFRSS